MNRRSFRTGLGTAFRAGLEHRGQIPPRKALLAALKGAHLWPSLTFNFFPGRGDEICLMYFRPLTVETSVEVLEFFLPTSDLSASAQQEMSWMIDVFNEEDMVLCERVQRGLHSRGYRAGRLVVSADRRWPTEHAVTSFKRSSLTCFGRTDRATGFASQIRGSGKRRQTPGLSWRRKLEAQA